MFQRNAFQKTVSILLSAVFFFSGLIGPDISRLSFAESLNLAPANQFVPLSSAYSFPVLKGLKFDPNNPLTLEFIVDTASQKNISEEEASALIKYFLAALTIPEEEIWVNLSPYEQDRIIPQDLGQTDLGKDLLSQDYVLKQLTSSLTYPESDTGKDYWEKTYAEVMKIARTTNLPVNTFNKIWIVPDKAQVYENENIAVISQATLKAMLEEDYLALKNKTADIQKEKKGLNDDLIGKINKASSEVMKETILPQISRDINSGKNFATLRQIYHSIILGLWFKKKFQDSLYAHYINKGKIDGIDLQDKAVKEKIYNHYVEAFKTGLYDYIKKDYDPGSKKSLKRRYYSGGFSLTDERGFFDPEIVTKPLSYIASLLRTYIGGPVKNVVVKLSGVENISKGSKAMLSKGFMSPAGIQFAHDKILKEKIKLAFKEGRAINLMSEQKEEREDIVRLKQWIKSLLYRDDYIVSLAKKILKISPGEKGRGLHTQVKQIFGQYQNVSTNEVPVEVLTKLKNLLIDNTRFIAIEFGKDGTDPYLFNIGDITSEEHRAIIAHIGTYAYEGSQGIPGGPRTIYLPMARLKGYDGFSIQELVTHELTDFVAGKHVPESLPHLTEQNTHISEMYKNNVVRVVEGTRRGVKTYDTAKVSIEKYTMVGDLGSEEVFALKGSSKVHPDVPKGSRPLNILIVKADVGSIGGHGSVPSDMLEAIADFWARAAEEGKIIDFFVTRCGDDISITVTHINGKDNPMMHKLAWDAFIQATVISKDLSLYGAGQDLLADSFSGNIKGSGPGIAEMEIIERKSEPIVILQGDKWAPGGFNEAIHWIYADPNSAYNILKPKQANSVQFGIIDFEANNKQGRWAALDPAKMKGFELAQALKMISGDQVRYSFTNLVVGKEDIAAVTASRLHNIAGEYTGKDDPMAVFRTQGDYPAEGVITAPFFTGNYKVFGWMMGSQQGYLLPVSLKDARIGVYDGPPLLTAFTFNINNGRLVGFMDLMAANPAVRAVQDMVGKKTAELLSSANYFTDTHGRAPAIELAYQKGFTGIDNTIPWQNFKEQSASSAISSDGMDAVNAWIESAIEAGAILQKVPESLLRTERQERKYVIGGNWKMNVKTAKEAEGLIEEILHSEALLKSPLMELDPTAVDIVIPIAPSFVHLQPAANKLNYLLRFSDRIPKDLFVLAAQDVSAYEPGARTGEVSARQLEDSGVKYVIVGHSERRRHPLTPESSQLVNLKAKQALKYGLRPIIAVGETLEEREAGHTYKVISEQVRESINGLSVQDMEDVVIAYEPVWAIGTGKTATPEQANEVHRFIRALILEKYGEEVAAKIRIQYGGSVNEKNIGQLIAQPNIDGGLIGGASLKPKEFIEIAISSLEQHKRSSSSALEASTPQINGGQKADWTNGGIDMQGIDIGASGASTPMNFKLPFDPAHFQGFTFSIVQISEIKDFDAVFKPADGKKKELASL